MSVSLDEAKEYLRLDTDDDNSRVQDSLNKAIQLCMSVSRMDSDEFENAADSTREAVLYTTAYLYTHREDADHHQLTLDLRQMLMDVREAAF